MRIQKTTGIVLAALLFAGGVSAFPLSTLSAKAAEAEPTALSKENAELFLPSSYEQYLPLTKPSDAAVTARYTAVAENVRNGSEGQMGLLYLYDRENPDSYRVYEHENSISKIQFTEDDRLYFADSALGFYELDLTGTELVPTTESRLTALSSFYIQGETLFSVNMTDTGAEYRTSTLAAPDRTKKFDSTEFKTTPKVTYLNGKFYSVVNGLVMVYEYNANEDKYVLTDQQVLHKTATVTGLESVCAYGGRIYYTLNRDASEGGLLVNGLYSYDPSVDPSAQTSTLVLEESGLSALTVYGNTMYCVQGGSVHKLQITESGAAFTPYEIASSSTSVNRLYQAVDSARARDILVTADAFDAQSGRVSIYNLKSGEFSQILCKDESGVPFSPSLVATDGEKIAVASDNDIYLSNEERTGFTLARTMKSDIKGLACVYGSVYFVTDYYVYGKIGEEEEAVRTREGNIVSLTADLYGTLYTAYSNGVKTTVYRFTEDEFTDNGAAGETVAEYQTTVSRLQADMDGNLYFLAGNRLYQNGEPFAELDGNAFVFRNNNDTAAYAPTAFALGFEDDEVYFLFGNFIIKSKTDALDVPCLEEIAVEGAALQAFSSHEPENLFAQILPQAVSIEINLNELNGDSEFFPYTRYYRTQEAREGVVIAETERYRLIVLFEKDRSYTANLFRKSFDTTVMEGGYTEEEQAADMYLSSKVSAYYAPSMHAALSESRLERGTRVTFLGRVEAPDVTYAYVEYTSYFRETARGYIPLSYLTSVKPDGEELQEFTLGTINKKGAGTLFTSDGSQITLEAGTQVKLYKNTDGTFRAEYERDGKIYRATVTENMLDWGESDALRISMIVILSVLAVVIIGAYIYLLPRKRSERKK